MKNLLCFSALLIFTLHSSAQTKTRVTGAANWNAAATWIQMRTGTIAFTSGSKTVTGIGTAFTSELQVGDILMLDASPATVRGTVASITSNTSLQLTVNAASGASTAAYGRQKIPGTTDDVEIGNPFLSSGATITLNISATIASLTFIAHNVSNTLVHSGSNQLTVSNAVTLNQTSANGLTTSWNINGGSATVYGLISMTGTIQQARVTKIVTTSGSLNAFGGIYFDGTTTANKVIDMSGGGGTLNLKGALSGSASATLTAGTSSIVNYADNVPQDIVMFGAGAYNDIYINNTSATGATLSTAVTLGNVKDDVRIYSGTLDNGGYAIALNSSNTFEVANGAKFKLTGSSGLPTGSNQTKIFGATSTVEYAGISEQTITAEAYGNLTSSSTGARTLVNGGTISIAGAFDPGTNTYTTTNSTVSFIGTTAQSIPAFTFNKLIIDNAANVTLTGDVSIGGTTNALTLTDGKVITGAHTLTLGSATTISGAGSSRYVYGNLKWGFATGAQTKIFVLGDAINYTPVTVAFASVTTGGFLTVIGTGAEHPKLAGSGIRTDKSVNRYWTLDNTGMTFSTAALTFNWVSADKDGGVSTGNFRVGKYDGSAWSIGSYASAGASSIQATLLTSLGEFAIGELCTVTSSAFSYIGTPYCSSAGAATPTIVGTAGIFTSTAGLSIVSTTGVVDLAASTPGTYTVTNSSLGGCSSSATSTIVVTLQPAATGSYPGSPFCFNSGTAIFVGSSNSSGTLSSTAGLSLNPSNGVVNVDASTAGTYSVTYTVPASGGCSTYTTSYPITISPAPSATISYAESTFCKSGSTSVSQTGTPGGSYTSTAGLSINATTGEIDLAASTVGTYTITYALSSCGGYSKSTIVSIVAAGTWIGAISNDWNDNANWACNSKPSSSTNVLIPSGLSRYPSINLGVTATANNITIQSGALVTLIGFFEILGSITNSGNINATNGTVIMKGSLAQVIPAGLFVGNSLSDLTVDNPAGVTLAGAVDLTDILTVKNGALTSGGYLTLKSSASGMARVSRITSNAVTPIIGDVTVERYIQGRRKYRLITSSVTTSSNSVLTVGQESRSIWGNWQNQGNNTTGNVGTIITGGTAANGFDPQTTSASMYTYNTLTRKYVAFNTTSGKNTKYTPLKAGIPYYMFVYGDRLNSISAITPNNTVLKATGTLLTGPQAYTTSSALPLSAIVGSYSILGNPYAAVIDWGAVSKSGLSNTIWTWDPNLSSTGGYVTVTSSLLGAIVSPLSLLTKNNQFVQPGQAFFVQTTGTNPTLTIQEDDKVDNEVNINSAVFREAAPPVLPMMAINLVYSSAGNRVLADGVVAAFDNSFLRAVSEEDGLKMGNGSTSEYISLAEGSNELSIDALPMPKENDTLFLNIKPSRSQYTLQIFGKDMESANVYAVLEDSYLQTIQPLSLTDTNNIVFNITADAASSNLSRFRIVFHQSSILPVTFTSIQASEKNKSVQVSWNVALEIGTLKYEVERSGDGLMFTKVADVSTKGSNNAEGYQWLDNNPLTGNNYYRIRAVQHDGSTNLTKVAVVKLSAKNSSLLVVSPNPIRNQQIKFQLNAIEKGQYTLELHNSQGQKIISRQFYHSGNSATHMVQLEGGITKGIYYLQVVHENENYHQTVLVE